MTQRNVITGTAGKVRVVRNTDWNEWICKPIDGKGADSYHHVDTKQEALDTAQVMANDIRYFEHFD